MRLLVVGAGATGTLFAARLSGAGHTVVLASREGAVDPTAPSALVVEGVHPGSFAVERVRSLVTASPVDGVLVATKTFDLREAGRSIARSISPPAPLLAPQNGLGVETVLLDALRTGGWADPSPFLVRAIHSVPATLLEPGRVRQAGEGEFVLPAESGPARGSTDQWAGWLSSAGYPVRRSADFGREVWLKVLVNAAVNPVTADHRILNGRLREDPWRGQALRLLEEARQVAAAEGIAISDEEAQQTLWKVVRATAGNRSSMLQDVEKGGPTEVDAICGEIVSRAERHGIDVPLTRRALQRLRQSGNGGGPNHRPRA